MMKGAPITVLFATSIPGERDRFTRMMKDRGLSCDAIFPETLQDADRLLSERTISLIVTDFSFAGGAFADWLGLWPRPFILLASYGEEARLDDVIKDESCSFLIRDDSFRHLDALPTMIRKVLGIRESLDRQNVHLAISERRYLELVSALPDIVYTLNGEGRFVYINEAVSQLGYGPAELIGKHFSEILAADDVDKVSRDRVLELFRQNGCSDVPPKLFDERRSGDRMTRNLVVRLKTKSGTLEPFALGKVDSYGEVSCLGFALPEYEGSDIGTVGIIRDISQRRAEELRLKDDLQNKELLLKEIHHRVKNNLQVVSSLLFLQGGGIEDERARRVFTDCQTQVHAMALVHEQLYRSDDLQFIDMATFLGSLVAYLFHVYDVDSSRVEAIVDAAGVALDIDRAIPVALIVNELVSNSLNHGLHESRGSVSVVLRHAEGASFRLEVRDTGKGLPADFVLERSGSLGLQLIKALASQLNGDFSCSSSEGSVFVVRFPIPRPSESASL